MKYPITEIFLSYQAEGSYAGVLTVFVRFAGCNYKCSWCDTDYTRKDLLSAQEILDAVHGLALPCKNRPQVCFTGGEPCLNDLHPLIRGFRGLGYQGFQIETNGSQDHEQYMICDNRAFVTLSPKHPDGKAIEGGLWVCDELKVVYQGQDLDCFDAMTRTGNPTKLFVQPLYQAGACNWKECLEAIKASSKSWRMSFQTNKWVGAR